MIIVLLKDHVEGNRKVLVDRVGLTIVELQKGSRWKGERPLFIDCIEERKLGLNGEFEDWYSNCVGDNVLREKYIVVLTDEGPWERLYQSENIIVERIRKNTRINGLRFKDKRPVYLDAIVERHDIEHWYSNCVERQGCRIV